MIDILQHSKGSHLGFHSGKEATWLLCIVAYHHEIVIQLRKNGLDTLPEAFICPRRWSPVLLIQPICDVKGNVGSLKQVLVYGSTQVALVPEDCTVVVLPLHILKILQVMHIGCDYVIGKNYPTVTAQGMELVSVIVHVLRGIVAQGRCMLYVILSHLEPVGACVLADLYQLGVNAEDGLSSINRLGYDLKNILAKQHGLLAALVELPTCNQVGNGARTFRVQPLEEVILTINTHCLCRDGKSHRLQVREREYSTTAGDISLLIYLIFCKFLAFLMIFSELCDEMAHIYDNST